MDAKEILKTVKIRATGGRSHVLETLQAAGDDPMLARDIIHRLTEQGCTSVTVTVYRALTVFLKAGLIRRIPAAGGALFVLTTEEAMPQLVCSRCGKIEEINDPDVVRYNSALMKNRGVDDDGGALLMYADCKRKECDE